ncbi:sporulation and spore germination protein [Anoxybacillus vitaminiphilus]|uniref:Sporulation and spore germination protein n=1 Tax=Paranoxybacillus vitaminiphilus TaxID=581036 RepID=A0A327YPI6_9BACL|nr:GerMN domain-containing protein [Anoxybacillus vitaminiphilus]RAK22206.1 sporulation and spore germination protein [Anoxybacillus vitaminiphilus]
MRRFEWNEKQMEQLLQQMPHIADERSKEAVYEHLSAKLQKKRIKAWGIPSMASAAALFLFIVLGSSFIARHEVEEKAGENAEKRAIVMEMPASEQEEKAVSEQSAVIPSRVVSSTSWQEQNVVVFGIPDLHAQHVIPVSILVDKDKKSYSEQFEQAKTVLKEAEWGLSESLLDPLTIVQSNENGRLTVRIPGDHSVFRSGTAGEVMFLDSIEETFRWKGIKEVVFSTDGKKGIQLSHTGRLDSLTVDQTKRGYFLYQLDAAHPVFLTPTTESFADIQSALDKMDDPADSLLQPAIPKNVKIEAVRVNGDEVTVQFSNTSQLENIPEVLWMLEAILLTAKEFGFKSVMFTGGNVKQIGPYTFNIKIGVPLAPNPMPLN